MENTRIDRHTFMRRRLGYDPDRPLHPFRRRVPVGYAERPVEALLPAERHEEPAERRWRP